jgi:hypothetical protein
MGRIYESAMHLRGPAAVAEAPVAAAGDTAASALLPCPIGPNSRIRNNHDDMQSPRRAQPAPPVILPRKVTGRAPCWIVSNGSCGGRTAGHEN